MKKFKNILKYSLLLLPLATIDSCTKLDENVYRQLRLRAAQHGVSMEEEARQIISLAVAASPHINDIFQKNFGKKHGIELSMPNRRKPHEPMDFE